MRCAGRIFTGDARPRVFGRSVWHGFAGRRDRPRSRRYWSCGRRCVPDFSSRTADACRRRCCAGSSIMKVSRSRNTESSSASSSTSFDPDRPRAFDVALRIGVQHILELHRRHVMHRLQADDRRAAAASRRRVSRVRLAMFLARSPMRSRSPEMRIAADAFAQIDGQRLPSRDGQDGVAPRSRAVTRRGARRPRRRHAPDSTSNRRNASIASATFSRQGRPFRRFGGPRASSSRS